MNRQLVTLLLLTIAFSHATLFAVDFVNGQPADVALGGSGLFSDIYSVAVDSDGLVFVCDRADNRILVFTTGATTGSQPIAVLGQLDMHSYLPNQGLAQPSASSLFHPYAVTCDNSFLYVADTGNNRVLAYRLASIQTGASASVVLGQQTFTTGAAARSSQGVNSPQGLAVRSSMLWVADTGNQRVLRFRVFDPLNGEAAEAVQGQATFTASGGLGVPASGTMSYPVGLAVDSAGALYVVDYQWNHVLRFNDALLKPDGSAADAELGQSNFGLIGEGTGPAGLHSPWGAAVDAQGDLWVADAHNNRVLRYNNARNKPTGGAADLALGQSNLSNAGGGSASDQLSSPVGVWADFAGDIWVVDQGNARVLRYSVHPAVTCKVKSASLKPQGAGIKIGVKGVAGGGTGIAFVEYSTTGGKRWKKAKGKAKWGFSATVAAGALKVQVRATDTRGVQSKAVKVKGSDFKKGK